MAEQDSSTPPIHVSGGEVRRVTVSTQDERINVMWVN